MRRPPRRHLLALSLALAAPAVGLTACTLPHATSITADVADPDVTWDGRRYVLHSTNTAHGNVPTWTSTDLGSWTFAGDALPRLPAWAEPGWTWAPSSVRRADGKWFLYFSAAVRGRKTSNGEPLKCIGVASASTAAGPFTVVRERDQAPLLCQPSIGGDIDPSTFRNPDTGLNYLVTKVDGNGIARPTKLENRRLASSLWSFAPGMGPSTLLASTVGTWEQQVIEGPDLLRFGGRTHLLYSGGDFAKTTYGEGQATCRSTSATCVRSGRLLNDPKFGSGAGGASAFASRTGGSVLAWHAYTTPNSMQRSLLMGNLVSAPGGTLAVTGSPAPAGGTPTAPTQRVDRPVEAKLTVPAGQPVTVPNARTR